MQRKLAAILCADVVGYNVLMQTDEAGTLERLKANRAQIFHPNIQLKGGRQFKVMGDGCLVDFPSAVAAVECALAIQEATEKAAAEQPEGERIRYRIGVNLGEVIVDGDDIYGEGVNIAARLQAIAPVGGVTLSRVAKEQVDGKVAVSFEDWGSQRVKDHERALHVFAVRTASPLQAQVAAAPARTQKVSICVLPFANISDDPQQEYFSDGITEDIITDLSKASALSVVARTTAFSYKGNKLKVQQIARELLVSHVLEGSVRKAGGRVRITAQLIDGVAGDHIWAERYDRDLNDIFAVQDEISEAIVKALKVRLAPEEQKAMTRRGTDNVEAYNVYLMARQHYVTGNNDVRRDQTIVRMCQRAVELDPGYAHAWALMALGQYSIPERSEGKGDGGLAATERAIALDPGLAEAHAVKARLLFDAGHADESASELALAISQDPDSYEVNRAAGNIRYRQRRFEEAIRHLTSCALVENDLHSPIMLMSACDAVGDSEGARRSARTALTHAEKVLGQDHSNGPALICGVSALGILGETERAKEWMDRALLIYPDNMNVRYNFACTLCARLHEMDAALEMLAPVLDAVTTRLIQLTRIDPDFDSLRNDPRFEAMLAAAEARLAQAKET